MKRRGWNWENKSPIRFLCVIIFISFMFIQFISILRLSEVRIVKGTISSSIPKKLKVASNSKNIGKFGEMVIEMLPEDLGFTLFLPSEEAFERDLGLRLNESLVGQKADDTNAILTRVLGFASTPRMISSDSVPFDKEINYDSLSGYTLYISKDIDGMLTVNGVRSVVMDLRRGKIVVHVMDGVNMDPEFEQSVKPDDGEGESIAA